MRRTAPTLTNNTPREVKLPQAGTVAASKIYNGAGGGTAAVAESTYVMQAVNAATGQLIVDPATGQPVLATHTVRAVTYTDYVNEEVMILNGAESTAQSPAHLLIHYTADIQVTGTHPAALRSNPPSTATHWSWWTRPESQRHGLLNKQAAGSRSQAGCAFSAPRFLR